MEIISTAARTDIDKIMSVFREMQKDGEIAETLGKDFVNEIGDRLELIEKRSTEPFTLVILGDFKRGKSTIINALLGREVAPSNVSPETYTINEISYGEKSSAAAVLENGQRVPLDMQDICRERLDVKMKMFPAKVDYLEIKDSSPILREIRLVDTPGLSDLNDLDMRVTQYLVNADAIMYAASCLLPFSESEQLYLSQHVQPRRFGILYVLVNMIDALDSQRDVDRILKRFQRLAEKIVPNSFVYGISGADELRRKLRQQRLPDKGTREFYETQFMRFELSLQRDIIMKKDIIRNDRVMTMLEDLVNETNAKLHMFSEMAELDSKKLEDKQKSFDEECSRLSAALEECKPVLHLSVTEMQQEAEKWMYEFFAQLRQSILKCRELDENFEPKYQPEDIEKYFYSYLMEKVGEAYRTCIEYHRQRLDELVEKMSRGLAKKLGIEDLSQVTQATSVDRLMRSVGNNVTRQVTVVKLIGTSDSFPPATMNSFSKILGRRKQTDIIDIALENYDDIRGNIVRDITKVYQDLEVKALAQLDAIYQYQAELGKEALGRTRELVENFDKEKVTKVLTDAAERMKVPQEIIEDYQSRSQSRSKRRR
ncbi:MAG: dynamin family protein [Ruminococcus sp.]|nr:dynamin family protein [Ruminococcus sp.]